MFAFLLPCSLRARITSSSQLPHGCQVRAFSKFLNSDIVDCTKSADLQRLILETNDNEFNAINISTAIHRLGKLRKAEDYTTPRNTEAVAKLFAIAPRNSMNPQTLVNIMHGISTGKLTGGRSRFPDFVYSELTRHQHYLRDFSPQALCTVFFSFAVLGQEMPEELARSYLRELEKRDFRKFHQLDFPQLLWSLGTLRLHCPNLYDKFSHELLTNPARKMEEFTVLSLSNMLWSFAEIGHPCEELAKRICVCLTKEKKMEQADHKFAIRFIWSLACLDMLQDEAVQAFFQTTPPVYVEQTPQSAKFYLQARMAWHQAHQNGKPSALLAKLDSGVHGTQVDWADRLVRTRSKLLSPTALHIIKFFRDKFPAGQVVERAAIDKGVYVDLLFPQKRLVIELESAFDYTAGGEAVMGSALFLRRLVKRAGYKLAIIDLKSFSRAYTPKQQDELLEDLARNIQAETT